jgi:hypothetical protein
VKLCQNFRRHFCYMHLTRNAVDSVAQHQHLSETASEPSTLDPPTVCSSKRISPFFNCLSPSPTTRTSWHPKCSNPGCPLGSAERGVTQKLFFLRHDEFTSDYDSAQSLLLLPKRARHFPLCSLTAHLEVAGKSSWSAQTMIR